jgi:uncharacterized protein YegL
MRFFLVLCLVSTFLHAQDMDSDGYPSSLDTDDSDSLAPSLINLYGYKLIHTWSKFDSIERTFSNVTTSFKVNAAHYYGSDQNGNGYLVVSREDTNIGTEEFEAGRIGVFELRNFRIQGEENFSAHNGLASNWHVLDLGSNPVIVGFTGDELFGYDLKGSRRYRTAIGRGLRSIAYGRFDASQSEDIFVLLNKMLTVYEGANGSAIAEVDILKGLDVRSNRDIDKLFYLDGKKFSENESYLAFRYQDYSDQNHVTIFSMTGAQMGTIPLSEENSAASVVMVEDINGDDFPDFLVSDRPNAKIIFYDGVNFSVIKELSASFDYYLESGVSTTGIFAGDIVNMGDINSDGFDEILLSDKEQGQHIVLSTQDGKVLKGLFTDNTKLDEASSVLVGSSSYKSGLNAEKNIVYFVNNKNDAFITRPRINIDDPDNDGVVDEIDAFPNDPTEQYDSDGDGVGDNTDLFPFDSNESTDQDGDSVGDNGDNCVGLSNSDQLDTDRDQLGDVCDLDDDGDNLPDLWESNYGLDPKFPNSDSDTDGDRRADYVEFLTDHSPVNSDDYPALVLFNRNISQPFTVVVANSKEVEVSQNGFMEITDLPKQAVGYKLRIKSQPANIFCMISNQPGLGQPLTDGGLEETIVAQIVCDRRYVDIENLSVETLNPSIVKSIIDVNGGTPTQFIPEGVLFDDLNVGRQFKPVFGLQDKDFYALENGFPLNQESFLCSSPLEKRPFSIKTVYLLDISSSLSFADLIRARNTLKSLVADNNGRSRLLPSQEIAIYTFDDQLHQVTNFTSKIDLNLLNKIDAIGRGGNSTNLYGAISASLDKWSDRLSLDGSEVGSLIVITDGEDTSKLTSLASVINKVSENEKSVYAIAVGQSADVNSLRQITGNFSSVYELGTYTQLLAQLTGLNTIASSRMRDLVNGKYAVYYASPSRAGTHQVKFGVNGGTSLSGSTTMATGSFNAVGFSNIQAQLTIEAESLTISGNRDILLKSKLCFSNEDLVYQWTEIDDLFDEFEFDPEQDGQSLRVTAKGIRDDAVATYVLSTYVNVDGVLYAYESTSVTVSAGDFIDSTLDNCPLTVNETQADTDGDSLGDDCDPDDDNDGLEDESDAYPLVSIGDLLDTDLDGGPNVCNEVCLALGMSADIDDDNDGVLDVNDAFPLDPTKSQTSTQKVKNDVDGDGKSDLLWRSSARGWNFLWAMDGVQTKQASPINVVQDEGWLMAGQGDYDADGNSGIFWRNTLTGQNFIYLMDGLTIKSRKVLNYVGAPQWELRGSGDFNGDGKGDVMWRRVDRGDTWFYMMDGLNIATNQPSLWVTDLNYKIVAIGDINGDDTDDVIWRHQLTGVNFIWIMENGQIANRYVLNAINADWTIAGAGDLDGDGTDDIILRNQVDGRNWVYLMENGQITTSQLLSTVSSLDWQIANMGDYDGDGKADLLWRNESAARNIVHLMDGLTVKEKGVLRPTDNSWQLAQ